MRSVKILKLFLMLSVAIATWGVTASTTQAQFGGLQIQIGGGYYGGGLGGISVPFGVGPSIPPTSRAYMGPAYGPGYRSYYGYSGIPVPGAFGVTPFGYSSSLYVEPAYRGYYGGYYNNSYNSYSGYYNSPYNGSGPYSGNGISNHQQQLDLYQQQLRTEQSQLHSAQGASNNYRPSASSQSGGSVQAGGDLRPGMVLPDGSTVLSVGPLSPTSTGNSASGSAVNSANNSANSAPRLEPNAIPTTPPPTPRKSNRAAF